MIQKTLDLSDKQVFNNIQRLSNTTTSSIPIIRYEAWKDGKIKYGNLVYLATFGAGFTWSSALKE